MNRKLLVILFFLAGAVFSARSASAATQEVPAASFVDPQAAEKANAHEDEVYASAKDALDQEQYNDALKGFNEVLKIRGRKADGALYWKAYTLNKVGNRAQALAIIGELKRTYPKSTWLREADIAEQQWRGSANPESISDEELKLLALQSIMNSDPEKAVPMLDKVIAGNSSPKVKDRALFVLSQSNSPKAREILLSLAKANNQPDLQKRAIRYMGTNGSAGNKAVLKEIYNSSTDPSVKKAVFEGWLMSGDKEDVLAAAHTEKNPELRKEAIRYLGMMGGSIELRQLYKESADADAKENLLQAMGIAGDTQGLAEAATSEKDPRVRVRAIRDMGIFGGTAETVNTLLTIYKANADIETKKAVAEALFIHGSGKELVTLARSETNPQMKRELIQKMSLLNSPEITEYMMEILNK
ncbi:MAG TPA: HEAT repeat domain-containing protein [Candidatus Angelobacter sp.]|jgi:HEAT repeat protein|nr:HEAT repeat domain-containing protein [Candidatus Angelobacter sp.]